MFISSNKAFSIRFENGERYDIRRGYIGEIPDHVASHWLIKAAIKDGSIATPASHNDKAIEAAVEAAEVKAEAFDLRPDAEPISPVEAEVLDEAAALEADFDTEAEPKESKRSRKKGD